MNNTYYCSSEDFIRNAKIPVRIMPSEAAMYEEIAELTASVIEENNAKGEKTVIICPVGPIGQYPVFARKVNERKISLKNCWFINMDEYLDENDEPISYENPLSFHATMDRELYSRIDEELVMPKSQRLFPEPRKEKETDGLIEKLGKVDLCLTGVGINGHIAFNEPAEKTDDITDEEYRNCGTRILDISRETIVNNGANKIRGALDIFPKRCITLGMKQLLKAKTLKVYLYCNWQWGIMRKMALENESRFMPVSFLQSHPNAEMVITENLYEYNL
ncbi:MAG TPA: glucosamine-6-phosphate isomerase [Clostridiales bacterium]|nr:glucosamine-6-phosphate isomerase [Clostridiales bacterium]